MVLSQMPRRDGQRREGFRPSGNDWSAVKFKPASFLVAPLALLASIDDAAGFGFGYRIGIHLEPKGLTLAPRISEQECEVGR
jgi:hypothetical protein